MLPIPVNTIRRAEPQDIQNLSALAQKTYTDAFGFSFFPDDLTAHLQSNLSPANFAYMLAHDTILVAEADGQMIGFVHFGDAAGYVDAPTSTDGALHKLYVLAEFQNQRVGSQLMDAALAEMASQGIEAVYLDVWEHNPGATRFYQRYGFVVIGERGFDVESGAETSLDLIMVRRQASCRQKQRE